MANSLTNDGQKALLEIALRGRSVLTTLKLGLTNAALTKTSVLGTATAGEPASTHGYARITITQDSGGWPTSALASGDWQLIGTVAVWTAAGGDITPFARVFLTDNTLLLGWWDTIITTIPDTTSFDFTPKIKDI